MTSCHATSNILRGHFDMRGVSFEYQLDRKDIALLVNNITFSSGHIFPLGKWTMDFSILKYSFHFRIYLLPSFCSSYFNLCYMYYWIYRMLVSIPSILLRFYIFVPVIPITRHCSFTKKLYIIVCTWFLKWNCIIVTNLVVVVTLNFDQKKTKLTEL